MGNTRDNIHITFFIYWQVTQLACCPQTLLLALKASVFGKHC